MAEAKRTSTTAVNVELQLSEQEAIVLRAILASIGGSTTPSGRTPRDAIERIAEALDGAGIKWNEGYDETPADRLSAAVEGAVFLPRDYP